MTGPRLLDDVYVAIFIDATVVNVRDGQVANRPIGAATRVSLDGHGHHDELGLWAGTGGDGGTKFWIIVLTNIRIEAPGTVSLVSSTT